MKIWIYVYVWCSFTYFSIFEFWMMVLEQFCTYIFGWTFVFICLGCRLKGSIFESGHVSVQVRYHQATFQSGCSTLCSHQQYVSTIVLHILVNIQKLLFASASLISLVGNVVLNATMLWDEIQLKDWVPTLLPFILYVS